MGLTETATLTLQTTNDCWRNKQRSRSAYFIREKTPALLEMTNLTTMNTFFMEVNCVQCGAEQQRSQQIYACEQEKIYFWGGTTHNRGLVSRFSDKRPKRSHIRGSHKVRWPTAPRSLNPSLLVTMLHCLHAQTKKVYTWGLCLDKKGHEDFWVEYQFLWWIIS